MRPVQGEVNALDVYVQEAYIAAGVGGDGTLLFYDPAVPGSVLRANPHAGARIVSVKWHSTRPLVLTGGSDGSVNISDLRFIGPSSMEVGFGAAQLSSCDWFGENHIVCGYSPNQVEWASSLRATQVENFGLVARHLDSEVFDPIDEYKDRKNLQKKLKRKQEKSERRKSKK